MQFILHTLIHLVLAVISTVRPALKPSVTLRPSSRSAYRSAHRFSCLLGSESEAGTTKSYYYLSMIILAKVTLHQLLSTLEADGELLTYCATSRFYVSRW